MPYDPGKTVKVGVGVIDDNRSNTASTAPVMDSNVREVGTPGPTAGTTPLSAPAEGNYSYRY